MAELTYREALNSVIEYTEMGYTVRSQDRLWIVFIFDLWSDGDWADFRYNRLYPLQPDPASASASGLSWAYDLDMDGVRVWTSRWEAEAAAAELRERLVRSGRSDESEPSEAYVMNLGDDARWEALVLGGRPGGVTTRVQPKFKGSRAAWTALGDMGDRWVKAQRAKSEEKSEAGQ